MRGCVCEGCVVTDARARCAQPNTDPEWWTRSEGRERFESVNRMRAKLLCFTECELFDECLEASWDEPDYIWAGLEPAERYVLRMNDGEFAVSPPRPPGENYFRVANAVMAGRSADDIADELGLDPATVENYLSRVVKWARARREREQGWGKPPALPPGTTLAEYQRGLDNSSRWNQESA